MTGLSRRTILPGAFAAAVIASAPPAFAQASEPFTLPPLPYAPNRNEPYIDAETMMLHHDRHHAAYVAALNQAAAQGGTWASRPLPEILSHLDTVPESVRTIVRNNGGGHANHTMFWSIMGGSGDTPTGDISAAITRDFGSFDALRTQFNAAGLRVFGSGWVFVTVSPDGKLALTSRPNQDTPLMDGQHVLLGNDVWEHAYYLTYRNRRADYLEAWWNVVDWSAVAKRYSDARAGRVAI